MNIALHYITLHYITSFRSFFLSYRLLQRLQNGSMFW